MKKLTLQLLKTSFIFTIIAVSSTDLHAQKAEFGIRYMPTFTSLSAETSNGGTIKSEATIGNGFGIFLGFNFTQHIGIQGEVIYNTSSQKYTNQSMVSTVNLKYVNIPLLLSLNTGKTKTVNLNAVAGPQIGLNAGSGITSSGGDSLLVPPSLVEVKGSDIGFAYGFGLDIALNPSHKFRLGIGYRGVYGLFDISGNNKNTTSSDYIILDRKHINTNSAYIGVSLLF